MEFPVVSKCTVYPQQKSTLPNLKLSVSDLPMLSCHYIQKGVLLTRPPFPIPDLLSRLNHALSAALSLFPPLSGRFSTDSDGHVYVASNDAGVDFIHADGSRTYSVADLLESADGDVPEIAKALFPFDGVVSYHGHSRPLLAVQVTELSGGAVFLACAVNHAAADGTSFWNFFNALAELSRGGAATGTISSAPDFSRDSVLISPAVLKLPAGGPTVTFSADAAPTRERIIRFSRDSILKLKADVNSRTAGEGGCAGTADAAELMGKQSNDVLCISSFQCLSALLWRGVTRARNLEPSKTTTFRMAVNCRRRLEPRLEPTYFGNAIQSIATESTVGEVLGNGVGWCAKQLNRNVAAHGNATVRRCVEDWERDPRCFPLGNFDGATITMGSSPRFPMYENDFGWGRPVVIRSGRANKFDGKVSAFPGRDGNGSVDLEVVLASQTMAGLLSDSEFMHYVTN